MPQPLAVTAFMASPGRFELPAPRLGGVCSIQLSYGDIFDFSWSRMERSASQDFDDLIIRRGALYPIELLAQRCRAACRSVLLFYPLPFTLSTKTCPFRIHLPMLTDRSPHRPQPADGGSASASAVCGQAERGVTRSS